uniref:Virulence protein n=1 Tax=Steinernema glaseri TaxID=37863 RepID=A0A1I8AJT7_9BILA
MMSQQITQNPRRTFWKESHGKKSQECRLCFATPQERLLGNGPEERSPTALLSDLLGCEPLDQHFYRKNCNSKRLAAIAQSAFEFRIVLRLLHL